MSRSDYLVLKEITKIYTTTKVPVTALKGIDLTLEKGVFASIVGPSGSGKSSLLHIMSLMDKFDSGEYLFDSINVGRLSNKEKTNLRKTRIGIVFQSFYLLPYFDVWKNVELPLILRGFPSHKRRELVERVLESVGILHKAHHLPTEMSGGEQQRACIARAIVYEPEVIFADEPTGNLDYKTGMEVFQLLRRLNKEAGKTIIMVTHNLELAEMTDRIIYLRDGRIVERRD